MASLYLLMLTISNPGLAFCAHDKSKSHTCSVPPAAAFTTTLLQKHTQATVGSSPTKFEEEMGEVPPTIQKVIKEAGERKNTEEMGEIQPATPKVIKEARESKNTEEVGELPLAIQMETKEAGESENMPNFTNCVNSGCVQSGTLEQYTKCARRSSANVCWWPEIGYVGTPGTGIPFLLHRPDQTEIEDVANLWCSQLGFSRDGGYLLLGTPSGQQMSGGPKNSGGRRMGKLRWYKGYDEPGWHWVDWRDGYWWNATLDEEVQGETAVRALICPNPPTPSPTNSPPTPSPTVSAEDYAAVAELVNAAAVNSMR